MSNWCSCVSLQEYCQAVNRLFYTLQQFAKNIFSLLQSIKAREEGSSRGTHGVPHTPSVVSALAL